MEKIIELSEQETLVIGNPISLTSVPTGIVASVYGISQLSYASTSPLLSNKRNYPHFTRLTPSSVGQVHAIAGTIQHYSEIQRFGWNDIAIISTVDEYGTGLSTELINVVDNIQAINVKTYRQYLSTSLTGFVDYSTELAEIKKSSVRVIVAFIFDEWEPLVKEANEIGLIGESYAWFVSDFVVGVSFTDEEAALLSRGLIGSFQHFPQTEKAQQFALRWAALDAVAFPTAGAEYPPTPYVFLEYDMMITAALAVDTMDKMGKLDANDTIPAELWDSVIRNVTFEGISGDIIIDGNGDRVAPYSLLYFQPETREWLLSGVWSEYDGYAHENDVTWYSNTTQIPDLDIREPFHYWSCHSKEQFFDKTGKTVSLQTPDGSDIDNIDSNYYCDGFIDCQNMSDESFECTTNFVILFIIFGIITGIMILLTLLLMFFVIWFGIIMKYRRLRVASPLFLLLLSFSVLVGYFSIYSWFGKPHPVSCAFQPWLLGLPAISMITVLCVKILRIWRIFLFPMEKKRITNLELLVGWFIVMIPAIVILLLWTIISTPTAKMVKHNEEHYVCATGGFTEEPGGIIFFSIFAIYGAFVLLGGVVISVLARNIPQQFNETKLLAVSIYNLAFLSAVVIPVYVVIVTSNPFVAWILKTLAVLYAFTATLFLQFVPQIVGVFVLDRCRNIKQFKTRLDAPTPIQSVSF